MQNKIIITKVKNKILNSPIVISDTPSLSVWENRNWYLYKSMVLKEDKQNKVLYFWYLLDKKIEVNKLITKQSDRINFWRILWKSDEFILSTRDMVHIWIFGWTWSGKSIFLNNIISQIIDNWDKIILFEKENDYAALFCKHSKNFIYYWNFSEQNKLKIINIMMLFNLVLNKRMDSFKKYWVNTFEELKQKSNWKEKRIFIIIDEYQAFRQNAKNYIWDEFDELMKFFITFTRSYWINIIISTQSYQSSEIWNVVKNNLNYCFFWKINATYYSDLNFNKEIIESLNKNTNYFFVEKNTKHFMIAPLIKNSFDPNELNKLKNQKDLIKIMLHYSKSNQSYFLKNILEILKYFWLFEKKYILNNYFMALVYFLTTVYKEIQNYYDSWIQCLPSFNFVQINHNNKTDENIEKIYRNIILNKNLFFRDIIEKIKKIQIIDNDNFDLEIKSEIKNILNKVLLLK